MKQTLRILMLVFLGSVLACFSLPAQTLTLYAIPPSHPINWKSPHQLVLSMGATFLARKNPAYPSRPMGHIIVELRKGSEIILAGMVANKKKEFFSAVLTERSGLGVLFKLFEGRLENKESLLPEIENRALAGHIAFITFTINDASYAYLKNYIDSFQLHGYDKLYNGLNEPRHGEGGGCSAFGMSFLELINLLDPEFNRDWMRDVAIPDKLIGGDLTGRETGLLKIFLSFGWANDESPHTHLKIYDPNLVYSWIQKKYKAGSSNPNGNYRVSTIHRAKGIIIEGRQLSCPQFPMFLDNPDKL